MSQTEFLTRTRGPVGIWPQPARIAESHFVHKSLSNWNFNIAVGCSHACRFCYVPATLQGRIRSTMADYNVSDPDAEWGKYVLVRRFDRDIFLHSLSHAESTPIELLEVGGNRAVIYCSTTDPYQVIRMNGDITQQKELHEEARSMVRESLELIREYSTLNVRILTRSPAAVLDFDIFKSFGPRLLFGMSLPTLDDRLAQIYEPHAPSPSARLRCLRAAADYGLNIFVAVAPMYPEIGREDLTRTLEALAGIGIKQEQTERTEKSNSSSSSPFSPFAPVGSSGSGPLTIFAEPINIRAENVARIAAHARTLGLKMRVEVFANRRVWEDYALGQLRLIEQIAVEQGLAPRLHLWPDHLLGSRQTSERQPDPKEHDKWIHQWWKRRSEWPTA
jgi:DNA repair photolyase